MKVTAVAGADTALGFVVGQDLIDVTAFGGYSSLAQSGTDTLITFSNGRTLLLKNVSAATVTSASFVGLVSPAPADPEAMAAAVNKMIAAPSGSDQPLNGGPQSVDRDLYDSRLDPPGHGSGLDESMVPYRGLTDHGWIV